jgi:hypothetical protein
MAFRHKTMILALAVTLALGFYASGGFFSGGLGRGLLGGFIGAGLFGLLFGHGLFGGLGAACRSLVYCCRLGFCSCCSNSSWVLCAAASQLSKTQHMVLALGGDWGKD